MIGSIRGKVLSIDGITALIELNNGLGYEVEVPANMLKNLREKEECFLYIHHVVREDAELLFGFDSIEARILFKEMLKVTGVGPKVALALLSTFDVVSFIEIIRQEQAGLLVSAPGVGKKTAERIVMELKDRFSKLRLYEKASLITATANSDIKLPARPDNESSAAVICSGAIQGLISLGYKEAVAMSAVKQSYKKGMTQEDVIVACLALISANG